MFQLFTCHLRLSGLGWGGLFWFRLFETRHHYPDLGNDLILAIFLVLGNSPETGNHGELCSRPKYVEQYQKASPPQNTSFC